MCGRLSSQYRRGAQVNLGEGLGATEFVEELFNNWDRELVLHGLLVEGAVVDVEVPRSIDLLHLQDRRGEGRRRDTNDTLCQHVRALASTLCFNNYG